MPPGRHGTPHDPLSHPSGRRPVRPPLRARRLWCRHGRAAGQQATTASSHRALTALDNLEHRGAEGADIKTGDGAGILLQIPDAFFRAVGPRAAAARRLRRRRLLPAAGSAARRKLEELLELNVRIEGQAAGLARRPGQPRPRRRDGRASRPYIKQLFVGAGAGFTENQDAFERKLYVIRRIVELAAGPDFYVPSFSSRTIVYKGMLIPQLREFFPDLKDRARRWPSCTAASRRTRSRAGSWRTRSA